MKKSGDLKKVSVIIPTYNRGEFLSRAVNSIVDQNYPDIEIIIVDDGSTDNTKSIVKKLIEQYPFIIYCKNTRTKGPSGARNTGILKASGDYIAFLDSDDVWLEGHLKEGLEILENAPHVDVIFGNSKVVDYYTGKHICDASDWLKVLFSLKSERIAPDTKLLTDNLFEALIKENFFHLGTSIIKKSLLNTVLLNESIIYAEDRDFAIRLYKEAKASFAYRETPVYTLYKHDSNLTKESDLNGKRKHSEDRIFLFKKYLLSYQLSESEKKALNKLIYKRLLVLAYLHRKQKNFRPAFLSILQSIKFKFSLRQVIEVFKIFIDQIVYIFENNSGKI